MLSNDPQVDVVLGEHGSILEANQDLLGEASSTLAAEVMHAADTSDLVIIFPSSPGSYAELGAFSMNNKIVGKLYVVIDLEFQKSLSFINLGPVQNTRIFHGVVVYHSYLDLSGLEELVNEHIRKVRQRKMVQQFMGSPR